VDQQGEAARRHQAQPRGGGLACGAQAPGGHPRQGEQRRGRGRPPSDALLRAVCRGEYGVIDELYVRPEYRGRNIERELLDEAVAISQRQGWVRLDVTGPESGRESGPR